MSISACGTAYYAGLVGKYWLERYARIPVDIDIASEFRYREPPLPKGGLSLFVSQSGETADTLATLRYCKAQGQRIASIVNVRTSTPSPASRTWCCRRWPAPRSALPPPRLSPASCRCWPAWRSRSAARAAPSARSRSGAGARAGRGAAAFATLLRDEAAYESLAHELAKAKDVLYLGRGISYPLALEGALKLKEISYIHAEGYAAGELKHGPIALIDENVPVIVVAPQDDLFDKTVSNMQEVAARGGKIILVSNATAERAGCEIEAHISGAHGAPASPTRCCTPCRCNCWPITRPYSWARTWTSRATWPSRSRWNKRCQNLIVNLQ